MAVACPTCGNQLGPDHRFCPQCGTPVAQAVPRPDVRKLVTILFADVAGSTALGERLDPEAVRTLMGERFRRMRAIIEHHGGTVEKFIGDAVMAVFGIPVVHEDDALRAVRAAAQIRDELATHARADAADEARPAILVRTGINTGKVVAGDP